MKNILYLKHPYCDDYRAEIWPFIASRDRSSSGKYKIALLIFSISILLMFGGCSSIRSKSKVALYSAHRMKILSIALQYKGTPYRRGGNTPEGFDCGGYVQFVFKQAGLDAPRTSKHQFNAGYRVARSELQKGDLVFFTKWKFLKALFPPSHVGIYIGNNRFIHAPSSGKTVRTDSLENVYWKTHYKGARNLLFE